MSNNGDIPHDVDYAIVSAICGMEDLLKDESAKLSEHRAKMIQGEIDNLQAIRKDRRSPATSCEDSNVAWLRYHTDDTGTHIETCSQDDEGAFKVWRHPVRSCEELKERVRAAAREWFSRFKVVGDAADYSKAEDELTAIIIRTCFPKEGV